MIHRQKSVLLVSTVATEWFCKISNEQIGPLSSRQLKAMADAGRLTAKDRVRQGAEGSWVPAGQVKGLFPATGSSAKVFDPGDVPVARPVDAPPSSGQPASRRTAEPVDLPVAQPVSASPQGFAQGRSAGTPPAAPAPPRPAHPGVTGEDSPTEDKPPPDPTGIFGVSESCCHATDNRKLPTNNSS